MVVVWSWEREVLIDSLLWLYLTKGMFGTVTFEGKGASRLEEREEGLHVTVVDLSFCSYRRDCHAFLFSNALTTS